MGQPGFFDLGERYRGLDATMGSAGNYGLKTVQVAVGINGKGQVGFLGVGGEIGGTATLTLTFKNKGGGAAQGLNTPAPCSQPYPNTNLH
jgi:hypothetical protein